MILLLICIIQVSVFPSAAGWWTTEGPWAQIGDIRLRGGSYYYGRVEVLYSGKWGTVCDDSWDIDDAHVVCKQLGFSSALAVYSNAYYGQGYGRIWMDDVHCSGYETSLSNCQHNGLGYHNCGHHQDASVRCQTDWTTDETPIEPPSTQYNDLWMDQNLRTQSYGWMTTQGSLTQLDDIRLRGGSYYYGRVEVQYNGKWGTVCDDSWDINDAHVFCKQLGFSYALAAYSNAVYGPGDGPILMDDVKCSGYETSLSNCRHNGFENHNCGHSEDASVRCKTDWTTDDTAIEPPSTQSYGWMTQGSWTQLYYEDLDCNFEAGFCGYTQLYNDDFDWTIYSGPTISGSTGPSYDHTDGTSYGYYVYIETSHGRTGYKARLQSPSFQPYGSHCVEFYYHMYGASIGSLKVYAQTSYLGSPIWSRYGSQGDQWRLGQIQIHVSQTTQIVFEGVRGTDFTGDIALDDIRIGTGACSLVNDDLDCDFEADFCGFIQLNNNFDWTRYKGPTPSSSTGPSTDHTYGTTFGYYVYIEVSSGYGWSTARLKSPSLQTYGSYCVEFYYHMYGAAIGSLKVYAQTSHLGSPIWSMYGSQGDQWRLGQIQIHVSQLTQIVFEGVHGGSYTGDIALDDIRIETGGCSSVTTDIPDITTYAPVTKFTGEFNADDIILHCGPSSFQVDIPKQLLGRDVHARDIYLGGDPYNVNCQGVGSPDYIHLNSSLTGCGTEYTENQTLGFYQNVITNTDNDSMVVYLIVCEYARSKKLISHFKTIGNIMKKKERGFFHYDLTMYNDINYTQRHYSYPVLVTPGSKLYFRAELQQAPENLEIHLRNCRATSTPTFTGPVIYEFIRNGCGVNSASVRVLTSEMMTQADFEIDIFRLKQELGNKNSQVWIHCEVVVCDFHDAKSECRQGCEVSRLRRSVQAPHLEATKIVEGPFMLSSENEEKFGKLIGDSKKHEGNAVSNMFVTGLSVVFLIMFLGLVIMGVALVVVIRRERQPTNQPLPNPGGVTFT